MNPFSTFLIFNSMKGWFHAIEKLWHEKWEVAKIGLFFCIIVNQQSFCKVPWQFCQEPISLRNRLLQENKLKFFLYLSEIGFFLVLIQALMLKECLALSSVSLSAFCIKIRANTENFSTLFVPVKIRLDADFRHLKISGFFVHIRVNSVRKRTNFVKMQSKFSQNSVKMQS